MNLKRNVFFLITAIFFASQVIIFMRYEGNQHPPSHNKPIESSLTGRIDSSAHKNHNGEGQTAPNKNRPFKTRPPSEIVYSEAEQERRRKEGPKMWWSKARGKGGGPSDWYVTGTNAPGDIETPVVKVCRRNETTICLKDPRVVYSEELRYPVWILDMPPFVNEEYRQNFLEMTQLKDYMKNHNSSTCPESLCHGHTFPEKEKLVFRKPQFSAGQLVVIEDAVYSGKPDAGWMPDTGCETGANYKVLEGPPSKESIPEKNERLVLFIGPQTSSFQHFIDRQLPDIAQAWDLVLRDDFRMLKLNENGGGNVGAMWKHLFNQMKPEVREPVFIGGSPRIRAKEMLFTCNVPRYHPVIWRKIQQIFGVEGEVPTTDRHVIMYLSRAKSSRKVLNEDALLDAMRVWIEQKNKKDGTQYVLEIFSHARYETFEKTRDYFNFNVRAVIGPHGGAFYNINFCPRETLVIEFFPFTKVGGGGSGTHAVRWPEGTWWQSTALGQNYWQMPVHTPSGAGDIAVKVEDVISILRSELD